MQDVKQQQLDVDRQGHVQQHVQAANVAVERQLAPLRLPVVLARQIFAPFHSARPIHEMPLAEQLEGAKHRRSAGPRV